jgi:hypothetical protein
LKPHFQVARGGGGSSVSPKLAALFAGADDEGADSLVSSVVAQHHPQVGAPWRGGNQHPNPNPDEGADSLVSSVVAQHHPQVGAPWRGANQHPLGQPRIGRCFST